MQFLAGLANVKHLGNPFGQVEALGTPLTSFHLAQLHQALVRNERPMRPCPVITLSAALWLQVELATGQEVDPFRGINPRSQQCVGKLVRGHCDAATAQDRLRRLRHYRHVVETLVIEVSIPLSIRY